MLSIERKQIKLMHSRSGPLFLPMHVVGFLMWRLICYIVSHFQVYMKRSEKCFCGQMCSSVLKVSYLWPNQHHLNRGVRKPVFGDFDQI